MNENLVKLLKEQLWYLGTYSDEPNVVPVTFKDVTADGKLIVGDVFLETTLSNLKCNGKISVSACNGTTMEGYQIKGTAKYMTEGSIVDTFKNLVSQIFNGAITAKGALIITPERVIVTTPGADNKKVIELF
ncbi:pyridoxamine 5'-phosphate oxidase family protein [Aminipila terrae]|uniref:Pyridoxamine 5'-phosphate oxidase family protein n=1 Tax=Aminipila terrae TaxID=2697030 RepID=A0A6P1MAH5_9FIRM|nr:pyridoxamine 5'-phosphate oxidase family protein [Aminipila terrae]QHI71689.1 pyridoxamine 5'-phosphate oxidase family protein [Aminipila terrae]